MSDQVFLLTGPRHVSRLLDNLRPDAESHTITVYGRDDLDARLADAEWLANDWVEYEGTCVP